MGRVEQIGAVAQTKLKGLLGRLILQQQFRTGQIDVEAMIDADATTVERQRRIFQVSLGKVDVQLTHRAEAQHVINRQLAVPQLACRLERFAVGQRRAVQLIERGPRGEGQGEHGGIDLCAEEQRLAALRRDGITDMHRFLRGLPGDQQRPQRLEYQERIGIPDAGFQRLPLGER